MWLSEMCHLEITKVFDPKSTTSITSVSTIIFWQKAFDQVRPGGMVAVITTKGTLDKANPTIRKVYG